MLRTKNVPAGSDVVVEPTRVVGALRGMEGLRIGDLARATGKSARALRLYEEMGLLTPGERTHGGFRVYGKDAIERVRWISELNDLGFTLADVKSLVDAAKGAAKPKDAMAHVRRAYEEKLASVRGQLARLTTLERDLVGALKYLDVCGVCAVASLASSTEACLSCSAHQEVAPRLVSGVTGAVHAQVVEAEARLVGEGGAR